MTSTNTERAAYIAGLRQLADVLQANPELRLPQSGQFESSPIRIYPYWTGDQREQLAFWARLLPGHKTKNPSSDDSYLNLTGRLHGLWIETTAERDEVCERIVVGTETVTEKVKDPDLLEQVPEIEVTEEREIVEWRCRPLFADKAEPAGSAVSS